MFKDFDIREESSVLGMESRSILKSIQTEEAKLVQSTHATRSDLHYFRARHNYYRLSLLRLQSEERELLEPILGRFHERIIALEQSDGIQADRPPPPFLQTVERAESPKIQLSAPTPALPSPSLNSSTVSSALLDEVLSQLQLVRLALTGDHSPESKKVLCDGIDRVIARIKGK